MKYRQINQYINADEVRVIGPDEAQIGVMTKDDALFKAKQMNMDLVMVAQKAKPPVVKIIDFNKFKYQQAQKQKEGAKKSKAKGQKEIRFTPFIGQKDFETRIERIKDFLSSGHKIKLTVKFTGRQITRKDFGNEIIKKAVDALAEFGTQDTEPKLQGKLMWITISPQKKIIKDQSENEKK